MVNEWPLTGREDELAFARRAAADPEVCGILLTGRAGVGKTRLAKAVLAELAAGGAKTHWVRAMSSASTIPLGAFAHLLPGTAENPDDRAQRLNRVAAHLARAAEGRRLVIGVDDAHLLDTLTATLVHQLAATATAFVVVTAPHGVSVPDPVFALWKDRVAERLDIRELTRPQTTDLVTKALGGRLEDGAEHRLWHLALGNPLFLRELVQGGLDAGSLIQRDGVWRWNGALTATPRLVELIETRTDRVDADERTLLELLAFGEPLGSEPLVRLGASRVLGSTERAGLVVSERSGRRVHVRLAHPLYAEVIRRRTSPLRQREVYRILARTLDLTGARRQEDKPRLVRWRLAAGLPTDPHLVQAAAEAVLRTDFGQAEQLAADAVQLGGGFGAKYLLARIRIAAGRHTEADALLAELAGDAVSGEQRARVVAARADNLAFGLGERRKAVALLDSVSDVDSDDLATVHAELLTDPRKALNVLGPVLDRNRQGETRLAALTVAAEALVQSGRSQACLSAVGEGLAIADRTPGARARLELSRIVALAAAGRLEEAEDLAGDGYREAVQHRWGPATAGAAAGLGTVALGYGNLRAAIRWLREAWTFAAHDRPFAFRPPLLEALVRALAMTGQADAAEKLLDDASPGCRAWIAAARGELTRATELAAQAADLALADGRSLAAATASHDLVRFGAPGEAVPRLESVEPDGALVPLYLAHARAAGDATALSAVATGFADLGARLLAAEAAVQAARAYRTDGKLGSATTFAQRARAWLGSCEDARTPPLELLEMPLDLTVRELEIARLVATGLTSRAVADRLVVSVRTVDNVLHGVYAKLGISGRRELASVVGVAEPESSPGRGT